MHKLFDQPILKPPYEYPANLLGANAPYRALKTTLKAETAPQAWESLHSDTSRPFLRPKSGRIDAKVIDHLRDVAMKAIWGG